MVSEISSHPLLQVVEFSLNPPASSEALEAVEEKIGASLAEPIRRFYEEANGLKLHWRIKSHFTEQELDEIKGKYNDYWIEFPENKDIPFAQINLISIDECINRNWDEIIIPLEDQTFEFQGTNYPHRDFAGRLKPFDLFSTYYCMAFFLEKGIGNPKVLLLSDYYIEWDASRITDFESYLEMLLVTRGIVESRRKIFGEYRGDLKPPLVIGADFQTQEHVPKLFRKNA